MKKSEKIYLDEQGYNELLENIKKLKLKIQENNSGRKEAFDAGAGDGWDSPEFEEIERKERVLLGELQRYQNELSRVEIIEKHLNSDIIDIGDIVTIVWCDDELEEETFKVVGGYPDFDKNTKHQEISINSPMGSAIYKKKVGDYCTYTANGKTFTISIKEKISN